MQQYDPLYDGDRRKIVSKVKKMERDNAAEARRYSTSEIRSAILAQVKRDHPKLTQEEAKKMADLRFIRAMKPHQGSVMAKPIHDRSAHAAQRKADRAKMKGSRR